MRVLEEGAGETKNRNFGEKSLRSKMCAKHRKSHFGCILSIFWCVFNEIFDIFIKKMLKIWLGRAVMRVFEEGAGEAKNRKFSKFW